MTALDVRALFTAACYTTAWSAASSGLILLNKYILSSLHFHYPLTLSSLGMAFSSLAASSMIHVFKTHKLEHKATRDFVALKIFPLGFLVASTLGFGNLAYLYLSVSFIQILKAATPVLTMVVLVAAGLDKPSTPVTLAVSVIAVGTAIASWGELAFSMVGFLIMLTANLSEALKLAAMQYLLGNLKLQLMESIYYFAPAGLFWMVLFIVPLELSRMKEENAWAIVAANPGAFTLAASLGFSVNLLSFGVIQSTSSLTFKVLGQLKNVAVVLCSVVLFGSAVSGLQALGYAVCIVGFFLYNDAKQRQGRDRVAELQPASAAAAAAASSSSSSAAAAAAAGKGLPPPADGGGGKGGDAARPPLAPHQPGGLGGLGGLGGAGEAGAAAAAAAEFGGSVVALPRLAVRPYSMEPRTSVPELTSPGGSSQILA